MNGQILEDNDGNRILERHANVETTCSVLTVDSRNNELSESYAGFFLNLALETPPNSQACSIRIFLYQSCPCH